MTSDGGSGGGGGGDDDCEGYLLCRSLLLVYTFLTHLKMCKQCAYLYAHFQHVRDLAGRKLYDPYPMTGILRHRHTNDKEKTGAQSSTRMSLANATSASFIRLNTTRWSLASASRSMGNTSPWAANGEYVVHLHKSYTGVSVQFHSCCHLLQFAYIVLSQMYQTMRSKA